MSRMNATAPAINIKETDKNYIMEVAAPGLKKEWVRVNIDNDGNLNIAIENKMEHKDEDKHEHYLRREFSYSNYQQCYTLPEDADRDKISPTPSTAMCCASTTPAPVSAPARAPVCGCLPQQCTT